MQIDIRAVKKISPTAKKTAVKFAVCFGLALLVSRVRLAGGMAPFGAALCTAAFCSRRFINTGAVFLGAAAACFVPWQDGSTEHIVLMAMLCGALCALSFAGVKKEKTWASAAVLGVYAVCFALFAKGRIYDTLMWVFEAAISMVMIFVFLTAFRLKSGIKRTVLLDEEIVGIAFVCLVVVLGLSDIQILGVYLRNIAAVLLSLIAAWTGGCAVGGAVGLLLGFGVLLCGGDPFVMGNLAMGGFIAGLLNKTRRALCGAGLVLINAIATFYVNDSAVVILPLVDSVIAIAAFCLIPKGFLEYIAGFVDANVSRMRTQKMNMKRFRELTAGRLAEVAEAFKRASEVFVRGEENTDADFGYVERCMRERVCFECEKAQACRGSGAEKAFKSAYAEYKSAGAARLPAQLGCSYCEEAENALNDIFYVYDSRLAAEGKVAASKKLAGEQLAGVGKVIASLGKDFDARVDFSGDLERLLRYRLETAGIRPCEISAEIGVKTRVYVKIRSCGGRRLCESAARVISEAAGVRMEVKKELCQAGNAFCQLSFEEKNRFRITAYGLSAPKSGNEVCGDTHVITELENGKFMLLLCDGMGSGRKAGTQSAAAAELAQCFYRAGFGDSTVIRSINRLLMLSSPEDMYSTMDICMIDRKKGEAVFTKIGSPPSFVLRGGGVINVEGDALPAGIVEDIRPSVRAVPLRDGDIIVMLSDGISDIAVDTGRFIRSCINLEKLQDAPASIISGAAELCGGRMPDDMTAIAAKIRAV